MYIYGFINVASHSYYIVLNDRLVTGDNELGRMCMTMAVGSRLAFDWQKNHNNLSVQPFLMDIAAACIYIRSIANLLSLNNESEILD
jgi:hypothetical protein